MYVPQHFALSADDVSDLLSGIQAADLVTAHERGIVATYLPFVFDPDAGEHGSLLTHVARNNRQWSDASTGEALVIVHGVDHYISPRGSRRTPRPGRWCRPGTTSPSTPTASWSRTTTRRGPRAPYAG